MFVNIRIKNQLSHKPPSKTPPVTSTMKKCPFSLPYPLTGIPLQGDRILLHVHCINPHLITIRQQTNIGISRSLITLDHLIHYALYPISLSAIFIQSLLPVILHLYDSNQLTTIHITTHYPIPPKNITRTRTPHQHRFFINDATTWDRTPPQHSPKQSRSSSIYPWPSYGTTPQ